MFGTCIHSIRASLSKICRGFVLLIPTIVWKLVSNHGSVSLLFQLKYKAESSHLNRN